MLTYIVKITPKKELYDEAMQALIYVARKTNQESGCRSYNIHQMISADGTTKYLLVYEVFNSSEDFNFHMNQDYTKHLLESFKNILALPIEIQEFDLIQI
jgi:quinol monooxygenase YgiN